MTAWSMMMSFLKCEDHKDFLYAHHCLHSSSSAAYSRILEVAELFSETRGR